MATGIFRKVVSRNPDGSTRIDTVELTPEEVAANAAAAAAYEAERIAAEDAAADLNNVEDILKAIVLHFAAKVGETPAEARADILARYRQLKGR